MGGSSLYLFIKYEYFFSYSMKYVRKVQIYLFLVGTENEIQKGQGRDVDFQSYQFFWLLCFKTPLTTSFQGGASSLSLKVHFNIPPY